jgi:hypothetical protein
LHIIVVIPRDARWEVARNDDRSGVCAADPIEDHLVKIP